MENIPTKKPLVTGSDYFRSQPYRRLLEKQQTLSFEWKQPLLIFGMWRILLLFLPFLATLFPGNTIHAGTAPYTIINYYQGTADFWTDRLLAVWARWDGEWYLQIINFGYTLPDSTPAFFPLYPLLVRLAGDLGHISFLAAGVLVSNLAAAVSFILFYNLTLGDFKNKKLAVASLVVFSIFPTSFFLSAVYTEALFMAFTLGAFLVVRHTRLAQKWWLAGGLVAAATLTRNIGVVLVVPLAWEWWQTHRRNETLFRFKPQALPNLAGLILPPAVALAGWLGFLWWRFGNPFSFITAESSQYWQRHSALPWATLWQAVTQLISPATFSDSNVVDILTFIIWALLVWQGYRLARRGGYPVSYLIFLVLAFLPGLTQPRLSEALFGIPRFLLVLFPAYQIIALSLPQNKYWRAAYGILSCSALVYLTIHFVQWGWVA